MKTACASLAALVAGLLCLPVVFSGGGPAAAPTTSRCPVVGGPLAVVLATIRTIESDGDYTAQAAGSSASGAYQFIDTTWGGFGGYPEAWMAPPAVQDAKAAINVSAVLAGQNGDVSAVPVVWYIGHLPPPGSPEWDSVPFPSAGNVLTPREYQAKWMGIYDGLAPTSPSSPVTGRKTTSCGAPAASTTPSPTEARRRAQR
jgi:hypothetical protein